MNDHEYIKSRLDEEQQWYSAKSRTNQAWHKRLQILQLAAAASIPFLATFAQDALWARITIGVLGIGIAVIAGLVAIYKYEEKWIKYRTTAESLKHEKFRYLTKTTPYNNAQTAFTLLVERVESLISQENRDWSQYAGTQTIPSEQAARKRSAQFSKEKVPMPTDEVR